MARHPGAQRSNLSLNRIAVGEYVPENAVGPLAPSDYQTALDSHRDYQAGIFHAASPALDAFLEQLHNTID
ncbi:MAG: hypothetical protein ACR2QB_06905 [Gammaproteobacteria bacterium]